MTTGNSGRLSYDPSSYESEVGQSTNPLSYLTNPIYARNCDRCYPEVGQAFPNNYRRETDPRVEIENTLSSRKWKRDKRQPNGIKWDDFEELSIKYGGDETLGGCASAFETRHSLLSDPKIQYKSRSTEHLVFSTLPIAAQDWIPTTRNPGTVSSRDVAIATYRNIMDKKKCVGSQCAPPQRSDTWPFKDE